ncbi:hypothetical protein [Nocardioides sp. URHA0020]|uniref:hypothetical protein n=1 Tax=Nocardioides sp. URHA0020 TaxID=1380392 RepID=UPI000A6A266C|nr:hypothetical protein [Nocardioides sp. URHA0020]
MTPTADADTARLQALAQLAEDQAAALPSASAAPTVSADQPVLGGDISWPQCPKGMGIPQRRTLGLPMPLPDAAYVVVGLTNGPGFTANPCLASQVDWIRERHLLASAYAVVSQPDAEDLREHGDRGPFDGTTDLGALANTGYQQALANVATMRGAGLGSPIVWMDVEHVPDFEWSSDLESNGAVVQGAARGYVDAGYEVGVYSTPYLWRAVVGDLALQLPEWRAAGQSSRVEALSRCGDDWQIQGGPAVLGQWVAGRRDLDVTCPGITDLGRWFRQY